jgi:hypothetical protein
MRGLDRSPAARANTPPRSPHLGAQLVVLAARAHAALVDFGDLRVGRRELVRLLPPLVDKQL